MKEIKTKKELRDIEQEAWEVNKALDLQLITWKIRLVDGYALLIGADCKNELELYYISDETIKEEGLELHIECRFM